jgi:hypothetical protein
LVVVSVHGVPDATSLFWQLPPASHVSALEHWLVPLPVHDAPLG